ncbi:hypothetical protein CK203_025275 [Vitis vinifera]|uniref:Transcription elongation factor Eaf N-terminal domain-containing protein n=1 Tax=Vitis vinifera TaxID=29760 RepID=A0A438JF03_VITVI|nr:hypothetical protein CK203_025275 [Vitis vinifera]
MKVRTLADMRQVSILLFNGEQSINNKDEPSTAPESDRWYDLTLGSSFKDPHSSTKFCTLRYEFKPASIDKNQPGSLHKNKENRVTVEFHNNQPGKPKVTFEGSIKRLRHVRLPGESAAAAATTAATTSVVPRLSLIHHQLERSKTQSFNKALLIQSQ